MNHDRWIEQGFWSSERLDRLWCQNVSRASGAVAIVDDAGAGGSQRSLDYGAFGAVVKDVEARLRRSGLGRGDGVALHLGSRIEAVAALLGCWSAGCTVVVIPSDWTAGESVLPLQKAGVAALIIDASDGAEEVDFVSDLVAALPEIGFVFSLTLGSFLRSVPMRLSGGAGKDHVKVGVMVPTETKARTARGRSGREPLEVLKDKRSASAVGGNDSAQVLFAPCRSGWDLYLRSHNHLRAQGLAVLRAASMRRGERITSLMDILGTTGLASALVPWLLTAGTLQIVGKRRVPNLTRGLANSDSLLIPAPTLKVVEAKGLLPTSRRVKICRLVESSGVSSPAPVSSGSKHVDLHLINNLLLVPVLREGSSEQAALEVRHALPGAISSGLLDLHAQTSGARLELWASGAAVPRRMSAPVDTIAPLDLGFDLAFTGKGRAIRLEGNRRDAYSWGGLIVSLAALEDGLRSEIQVGEAAYAVDPVGGELNLFLVYARQHPLDVRALRQLLRRAHPMAAKRPSTVHLVDSIPRMANGCPDRQALLKLAAMRRRKDVRRPFAATA